MGGSSIFLGKNTRLPTILTFAFLIVLHYPAAAQKIVGVDTSLIYRYRAYAMEWSRENPDSSIFYFKQAINEASEILGNTLPGDMANDSLGTILNKVLARCHIDLGNELFWKGNYQEALEHYNEGLIIALGTGDTELEGECYGEMATIYRNLGRHSEALEYNTKAISIAEMLRDDYWKGILYNNRGVILQAIGDYPGALKSFFTSLELYDDIPGIFPNVELLNVGKVYELQGDLEQALKYFEQSLEIVLENDIDKFRIAECYLAIGGIYLKYKDFKKARVYFFDALKILIEGGYHYRIDFCYSQIGESYLLEKAYNQALIYFNNALEISLEKEEIITAGNTLLKMSEVYLQQEELQKSLDYANRALEIADTADYLEMQSKAYDLLIVLYEKLNDIPRAFEYQKKNNIVKDSLFNDQKLRALADMETKYETERKEMELTLAEEQKQTAEQKLRNNRIIYAAIIAGLAIISIFFFIFHVLTRQRSRLKLQAYEEKQRSLKREFEQKKSALQLLSLKNQLNPHFIFNVLNSIGSSIVNERKTKAYDLLTNFSELIRSSLDQADKVSVTLNQELEFVTNYLVLEKNRFKEIFDYKIEIDKNLSLDTSIPRMGIQVFVENAIKHGLRHKEKDGLLHIDIRQQGTYLSITIRDNGIGRLKAGSMPSSSTGRGLAIINEMFKIYEQLYNIRIEYNIKDKTDSKGNPEGTEVNISMPIMYSNGN